MYIWHVQPAETVEDNPLMTCFPIGRYKIWILQGINTACLLQGHTLLVLKFGYPQLTMTLPVVLSLIVIKSRRF